MGTEGADEGLEHLQFPVPCLSFPHGITMFWSSEKGCYVDVKVCMCIKNSDYTISVYCRPDPTRREE